VNDHRIACGNRRRKGVDDEQDSQVHEGISDGGLGAPVRNAVEAAVTMILL
jgi:hypothetical protein